ncbi:MAG TPA: S-layer homology domain-containing protein [Xenococcaceae cyanobacterium]
MFKLLISCPKFSSAILSSLLLLLTGCSSGEAIQSFVSPDPQLNNTSDTTTDRATSPRSQGNNPGKNNDSLVTETPESEIATDEVESPIDSDLPPDFPPEIPLYPEAMLETAELEGEAGQALWRSPDRLESVVSYYQSQFEQNEWEIVQPFANNLEAPEQTIITSKDNLQVKVSVLPQQQQEDFPTQIMIAYQPVADAIAELPNNNAPINETPIAETAETETSDDNTIYFTDLNQVPEQLGQAVAQVAALDILTPYMQEGQTPEFAPNQPVTRRDYARWLVAANNKYYGKSPGKEIRLGTPGTQLAFSDIEPNDPDFGEIQGLAEAGLIPSVLTGESDEVLFRPDAPLTREDLLQWKVPLDLRKALPKASIENIQESWGFQDATSISTPSLRALFADYQNGDRSNVRRIFGYTTLFQPQKPVTRGEAAASLWYFGFQGDGITAKEAAKINSSSN